jgi:hypothetical protein
MQNIKCIKFPKKSTEKNAAALTANNKDRENTKRTEDLERAKSNRIDE